MIKKILITLSLTTSLVVATETPYEWDTQWGKKVYILERIPEKQKPFNPKEDNGLDVFLLEPASIPEHLYKKPENIIGEKSGPRKPLPVFQNNNDELGVVLLEPQSIPEYLYKKNPNKTKKQINEENH